MTKGCFWCVEARKGTVESYKPCEACNTLAQTNVMFVEVEAEPIQPNQEPISEGMYPSGRLVGLADDFVVHLLTEAMLKDALTNRWVALPEELFMKMYGFAFPEEEDDEDEEDTTVAPAPLARVSTTH